MDKAQDILNESFHVSDDADQFEHLFVLIKILNTLIWSLDLSGENLNMVRVILKQSPYL